jgi:hypothetical protein
MQVESKNCVSRSSGPSNSSGESFSAAESIRLLTTSRNSLWLTISWYSCNWLLPGTRT